MSSQQQFDYSWLRLREPLDHQSRSLKLVDKLLHWKEPHSSLSILDLGTGTGSNLRYLAPKLAIDQNWILADNDKKLLDASYQELEAWADANHYRFNANNSTITINAEKFVIYIEHRICDINSCLDSLISPKIDLLTASALLDLCSASWLENLANLTRVHSTSCFLH